MGRCKHCSPEVREIIKKISMKHLSLRQKLEGTKQKSHPSTERKKELLATLLRLIMNVTMGLPFQQLEGFYSEII